MFMLILQSLILIAVAYLLGCILGCLLGQWFGPAATRAADVSESAKPLAAARADSAPLPPPPPRQPFAKPVPAPAASKPAANTRSKEQAAKPKAKPAVAAASARKDNLKLIKGIGPQNEARLNALGVTAFEQIASWSRKEQADFGERLAFPGRVEREEWVKQARQLAKGAQTDFAKRVEKGEVASSTGKASLAEGGGKPPLLKAARRGKPDNLTLIDGIGNALEKKLFALGVFHFDQIAKWSDENCVWIGNELGFPGRPQRENWVAEANKLQSASKN